MSKKKVISIISLLLVLILSVSAVSYSIATWGSGNENTEDSNLLAANTSVSDYKTTIDMIIEYSNAAGDNHQDFNIVEIVPGATAGSSLKDYVEGGNFKSYVLDANKSKTSQSMNQKALTYNLIQITQSTTLDSIKDILGNADLIYLSNPSYSAYDGIMNEDIYNWLHNYAMGKNKPLIMDYVTKGDNGNSTNKNYTDLINNISGNYIRYSTYSFGNNSSLADFVNRKNGSYFLPFNTNTKSPTGKILVIGNGNIKGYLNDYVPNGSPSLYYGNNQPGSLSIDTVLPNAVTVSALDGYDFIIIESDAKNQSFSSQDVYTKLKALSESGQFIIYDNSLKSTSSSSSGSEFASTDNYLKLMALVMSTTGISKQNNIMSVKYGFFDSLQMSPGESDSTKAIAAIINSGLYKDGTLDGESGQKFRVLEIEPCYPIDLDIATSNPKANPKVHDGNIVGSYYTNPSDVRYNTTKDDLSDGEEYYAFKISAAKIAHATGLPESSIEVDQMSVNQLISTKDVILENYDLVYIGCDHSAFTPKSAYNFAAHDFNFQDRDRWAQVFTYFEMYSHTGAYAIYHGTFDKVGSGTNSVPYNGYDITYNKLVELKDYVDSGLPLIIDSYLYSAYNDIKDEGRLVQLANKNIDPDSNMYKLLAYVDEKENTANSGIHVMHNYIFQDGSNEVTDSIYAFDDSGLYNRTAKGTVTVYKNPLNTDIGTLITSSSKRPGLIVKSRPIEYDENDDTTVNKTDTVSVTVGLSATTSSSSTYTATLLIDKNGNNLYDESSDGEELQASQIIVPGGEVVLSGKLQDEFFGLVNWKVKITDNSNGKLCDVRTGSAFFKPDDEMKKTVRVLQIMPVDEPDANAQYWQDGHSLYFCTECQQSSKIIKNNVTLNNTANVWDGNKGISNGKEGANSSTDAASLNGVTLGKHEHNFGIVMYDTQNNRDNWENNIADDLTHGGDDYTLEDGEFEFDLDIVTTSQFDALASAASTRTETQAEAAALVVEQKLQEYESLQGNADLKAAESVLETKMYTFAANLDASNGKRFAKVIKEGIGTVDNPGLWMKDKKYYKLFTYTVNNDTVQVPDDLKAAYNNYIVYKDQVVEKKEEYKDYARQSGDKDTWLTKNYDIIVLGLADRFGNKDLSTDSCNQLLTYVNSGGFILNSHDTLTADASAVNLTKTLRSALGMDRFHVTGVGNVSKDEHTGVITTGEYYTGTEPHSMGKNYRLVVHSTVNGSAYEINAATISSYVSDQNIKLRQKQWWDFDNVSITEVPNSSHLNDYNPCLLNIEVQNYDNLPAKGAKIELYQGNSLYKTYTTDSNGKVTVEIPQDIEGAIPAQSVSRAFKNNESYNYKLRYDSNGKLGYTLSTTTVNDATTDLTYTFTLYNGSSNTNVIPNHPIQLKLGNNTYSGVTDASGEVTFTVTQTEFAMITENVTNIDSGSFRNRNYATEDSAKYFFTERFKATPDDYETVINNAGVSDAVYYNAPLGVTDMYAAYNSIDNDCSNFAYASTHPESFDHNSNVNPYGFEAKYGTRRIEKVNKGGVTTYPFAISDTLFVSPTHAQHFALDVDDEDVVAWYTLAGNFVSDKLGVTAYFSRYTTAIYAASPKDGMNNYFLYSKENVFYTGAGHQIITGDDKDNNDERRLFINVIVNSVSNGKAAPKLKLYNQCDVEGCSDTDCDHNYVDPKDKVANEKLAKEMNTLFYNGTMYQYNIEDSTDELYPNFDYKVIAGSAELREIKVFYDLDYATNMTDVYSSDPTNHKLIASYERPVAPLRSGVRDKLNKEVKPTTLKIDRTYLEAYNNKYTYIVIYTKDMNNKVTTARVKINIVPHLFDLTDATTTNSTVNVVADNKLDMTDRYKFNI